MSRRYRDTFIVAGLIGSVLVPASLWAKTYLIAEDMSSSLRVGVEYRITVPAGISKLSVKTVWVPNKGNPASQQKITDFKLIPSVPATNKQESTDQWGNRIIVQSWARPPSYLSGHIKYRAILDRSLERFHGTFPYPIPSLPEETRVYLQPTDLIQSNNPGISVLAKKLLGPVKDQVYAVAQVLNFVIDHIRYRVEPSRFDAVYTLQNGLGNCQNYAHLAAALLRQGGIPARIVTGITAKKGWQAKTGTTSWNLTLGQGRHAWLEVFYPNFGWVEYDPQQTLNFVSTRHIAIEVGSDTRSSSNDGTVVWSSSGNAKPAVEEKISIVFDRDKDSFTASGEQPAPRNHLFSSPVAMPSSEPKPEIKKPIKPALPSYTLDEVKRFRVAAQRTFGNLDFPRVINIFARDYHGQKGAKSLRRSFVSETAEYVTSRKIYAQKTEIPYPFRVYDISPALHKFGGQNGSIWITVRKDEHNKPGAILAVSSKIAISTIGFFNGYRWVPFPFGNKILLSGNYWISLDYSGDAIFNWFYLLGNPHGGPDDTRSSLRKEQRWDTLQNYDFNFMVRGYELRK